MPTTVSAAHFNFVLDTVRDCGRAFAAGDGVTSGKGVAACGAPGGGVALVIRFPSRADAGAAAEAMIGLARMYQMDAAAFAESFGVRRA